MSIGPKRLWAVFYLAAGDTRAPDELLRLANRARAMDLTGNDGSLAPRNDTWAGMSCEAFIIQGQIHRILIISFWQSDFLSKLPDDEDQADESALLASTFRDACEMLQPRVAFMALHLDQATADYVLSRERWVVDGQANHFATDGLGLLYFDPDVDNLWVPGKRQEERDYLNISRGRLMFAGSGRSRWFGGSN